MTRSPARVALPGERGAYSEDAIIALWPGAEPVPKRDPLDVTAFERAAVMLEEDCGRRDVETPPGRAGVLRVLKQFEKKM